MKQFQLFEPFIYLAVMMSPLIPFVNKLLFRRKTTYDDCVIMFMDIEPITDFNNIYYEDKQLDVTCSLENEHEFKRAEKFDIFGNLQLNGIDFDEYMYNLRDFIDFCEIQLNKKTFIILNTSQYQYERIFYDYDVKKIINIKDLYGYYNPKCEKIPDSSSFKMLMEIINEINSDMNTVIDVFEKW